jgi:hypothetical protein
MQPNLLTSSGDSSRADLLTFPLKYCRVRKITVKYFLLRCATSRSLFLPAVLFSCLPFYHLTTGYALHASTSDLASLDAFELDAVRPPRLEIGTEHRGSAKDRETAHG